MLIPKLDDAFDAALRVPERALQLRHAVRRRGLQQQAARVRGQRVDGQQQAHGEAQAGQGVCHVSAAEKEEESCDKSNLTGHNGDGMKKKEER